MKAAAERQSNLLLLEFLSIDPVPKRSDKKNSGHAGYEQWMGVLVNVQISLKDFLG